ncbi:S-layer homology domain-containing protein [uncultured Megasphaera sp.]|uniref:S-layer homology domain-containing protein n=1 Tax=uncultured Megasphaera sp. TaxID=165188 RepID=UPI002658BA2A|nr:S-layer homology domain-containing protein [uncultured Megasphaera sp.]
MKRNVLSVLAAAAIFAAPAVFAAAPYTDLQTLPSREAVDYMYDTNCLSFAAGTQFYPDKVMTRGEVAQLVYETAASLPLVNPDFKDVQPGQAGDAIAAVAAQGILSGYADGSFQPDKAVTREEFADVVYRYLQYCHLADADGAVSPYADEDTVAAVYQKAVSVLHSKNLMTGPDNLFRPKDGITRAEAVETMYRLHHSDKNYVSHVQVMLQVMKALNAEYGSTIAYFRQGTMYWEGDTLILGVKGGPGRYLVSRIQNGVDRADAVSIRRVHLSRTDYDQLMNRAVNTLVEQEGVQNYIGSVPDFVHEQIVITVRRPVSETTLQELTSRVGKGLVRIEVASKTGQTVAAVQEDRSADEPQKSDAKAAKKEQKTSYSSLVDQATSDAIASVQSDNLR